MSMIHTNKNVAWTLLQNENIYEGLYNVQYATKMSNTIDALVKIGCSVNQIYNYFQELGINIYENHIQLYLKYGISYKNESELPDLENQL